MSSTRPATSEYTSYLALDEFLTTQRPRSEQPDELLFIIAHQVHELWFKLLLHEFDCLRRRLETGDGEGALHTLRRAAGALRATVSPIEVLQTLTPRQFAGFRSALGTGSGTQSAQFRELEAVLGRRDARMLEPFPLGGTERRRVAAAMDRPSVFDSLLAYLAVQGSPVPLDRLHRDVSLPLTPSSEVQELLADVYRADGLAAQLCEHLVEIDMLFREWRVRHVGMVERIIGDRPGTGGTTGAAYLHAAAPRLLFPDLWAARRQL
ncbi:tryptophan 2,3-dioxygenase [Actinoalloteichus hoggarensis]|nr:tryptophan 2,3-dioxygenase family protein [Actinoalloteichus hoggarensis]MBB5920842.1 tryptophan 2,3-dioxygenase [Actinoalloteichus hoggarensis]